MGGKKLNAPVQSLVPDADGLGHWLVASDGGVFAFQADFKGSMGGTKQNRLVTAWSAPAAATSWSAKTASSTSLAPPTGSKRASVPVCRHGPSPLSLS
jgi:hypothetical protein